MPVPLPDDGHTLDAGAAEGGAARSDGSGGRRPSNVEAAARLFDERWQDAAEKAKRNRTVFAQRRLKPEDVLPEWHKTLAAHRRQRGRAALHGPRAGAARVGRSSRCGAASRRRSARCPRTCASASRPKGSTGTLLIDFDYPPAPRCRPVQRSHPLVVGARRDAARAHARQRRGRRRNAIPACSAASAAGSRPRRHGRTTVAAAAPAPPARQPDAAGKSRRCSSRRPPRSRGPARSATVLEGADALALLAPPPLADPPPHVRERAVDAGARASSRRAPRISTPSPSGARQALLADHRRVREAADARGSYSVKALLPAGRHRRSSCCCRR